MFGSSGTTLILLKTPLVSVLYGDEQFGDIPGGKFLVFGSNGVSIVDPDKCAVEEVIEKDAAGNLLPGSWSDGVYMESETSYYKYVVINSRVPVSDTHGEEEAHGEVVFSDAKERTVASRVIVGPRPVHSYGVFTQNQYWTHADGNGFFCIIDLEDIDAHVENPIRVHDEEPSHGKLMWDEDGLLEGTGYATSTGEPLLFIFDMETHAEVGRFNFTQWCKASHSIGFSSTNRHLYIECSRGAPTLLELDVSSPREPKYVNAHVGITGSVYKTPDAKFIAVTDKGGSKFHLIWPGPIGSASSVVHSVDVYGHPSTPVFFPREGAAKADGAANFNACLSLTVNTNQNHYGDGEVKCSYYGCARPPRECVNSLLRAAGRPDPPSRAAGGLAFRRPLVCLPSPRAFSPLFPSPPCTLSAKEDVDAGVCMYALDAKGQATNELLSVSLSQINSVKGQFSPFNRACDRCADENYDEDDQMCTCTPSCGTCALDEAADHGPNCRFASVLPIFPDKRPPSLLIAALFGWASV